MYELKDMKEFSELCQTHNSLVRLNAITLTFPLNGMSPDWLSAVNSLLLNAPLTAFQLYATGERPASSPRLSAEFVERFTKHHGEHLTRFAVLRSVITLEVLEIICSNCIVLEQLFILMSRIDMVRYSYSNFILPLTTLRPSFPRKFRD